jgi:3-hydroxybutyryl-CoA dehydrogenase
MGHQITLCAALAGYEVKCTDISSEMLEKAQSFAQTYLPGRVAKGKLSQDQADRAWANLQFTNSLEEAVSDADYVIEAAVEKLGVKRKLFADIDRLAPPHAILATNSSYILSSKIADATKRPDKVCNMHFFNPALVMKLVEVVQGPHTSVETAQITVDFCKKLGKTSVWLKKEISGFLVNRILDALNQEALFLADIGIATPEEIDIAVVNALGHPMGPFRLMDLTGIDLNYIAMSERYQESWNPKDKPSPLVVEKYVKGEWGVKTKKGFYSYEK